MATYFSGSFLGSHAPTDLILKIFDNLGDRTFGINVCQYEKATSEGAFLYIYVQDTDPKILEFASSADAAIALDNFLAAVDALAPNCKVAAGITNLNGETGTVQAFANDVNVHITSASNIHTLNWAGLLAISRGGTNIGSYVAGDTLYASATNVLSKLTIGATGQVLTVSGSGFPSWVTPAVGITSLNGQSGPVQGFANDTNVTISSAGNLHTLGWTGLLAINRGGTNSSATPTAGSIAYGTGTAYAFTAIGTSGQVLTSSGAGVPTWSTLPAGGWALTGNTVGLDTDYIGTNDNFDFSVKTNGTIRMLFSKDGHTLIGDPAVAGNSFFFSANAPIPASSVGFGVNSQVAGGFRFGAAPGGNTSQVGGFVGSGAGGQIIWNTGAGGSITGASGTDGQTGGSGQYVINTGVTQSLTIATTGQNTSGDSGAFSLNIGSVGAASGSSGTNRGGGAGNISLLGVAGGSGTGGTQSRGGLGTTVVINAGAGGLATGAVTNIAGDGGSFTIRAGNGGNATGITGSRFGGNGGNLQLIAGSAGTGTTANGTVGLIMLSSPVQYAVGAFGVGKVLTSDGSGNATWQTVGGSGWSLTGNAGTVPMDGTGGTNFLGTTDNTGLVFKLNNVYSGFLGTADGSVFFGANAGYAGSGARNSTIAVNNVAIGTSAFPTNASLTNNANIVAIGNLALGNTATATTIGGTVAIGAQAHQNLTNASGSAGMSGATAVGYQAGMNSGTGQTTFLGFQADGNSGSGVVVVIGSFAKVTGQGGLNQGSYHVVVGANAFVHAKGTDALVNPQGSIAIGYAANVNTSNTSHLGSIAIGNQASVTGNNAIAIGNLVTNSVANSAVIGNTGYNVANGGLTFYGALRPNALPGTAGQVLTSAGNAAPPTWTTIASGIGPGTTNRITYWTSSTTVGDSIAIQGGTVLTVNGSVNVQGGAGNANFYSIGGNRWLSNNYTAGSPDNTNIFLGANTGVTGATGSKNILIGTSNGSNLAAGGYNNIMLGNNAGQNAGGTFSFQNVFIGTNAGQINESYGNVYIGDGAGALSGPGTNYSYNSVVIGIQAARAMTSGYNNTVIGAYAAVGLTTGQQNLLLGTYNGSGGLTTGNNNVHLGNCGSGTTDSNNILIGIGSTSTASGGGLPGFNKVIVIGTGGEVFADNTWVVGNRFNFQSEAYFGHGATTPYNAGGAGYSVSPFRMQVTSPQAGTGGFDISAAAGTFTMAGSYGAGTGPGGDLIFQTARPTIASSDLRNSLADVLVIRGTRDTNIDCVTTFGALIVPRLTTAQRTALTGINGMVVYDTNTDNFYGYKAGVWTIII